MMAQKGTESSKKDNLPVSAEVRVGLSVAGYYIGLGVDNDKYGAGAITILQGKNLIAKFSYMDFQKLDAFLTQNAELFNRQLDKELEAVSTVKRR